jgi:hypothetical protein
MPALSARSPGAGNREMRALPPVKEGPACWHDLIHQSRHHTIARLRLAERWRAARNPRRRESNFCRWADYGLNAPPARTGATAYRPYLRHVRARSGSCGRTEHSDLVGGERIGRRRVNGFRFGASGCALQENTVLSRDRNQHDEAFAAPRQHHRGNPSRRDVRMVRNQGQRHIRHRSSSN